MIPLQSDLSFLEKFWCSLFEGRDPWLTLAIVSFIYHELVYFGRFVPFWIMDQIPYFQKYKIQEEKTFTKEQYKECLKGVLFGHFFVELPLIFMFHPIAILFGMKVVEVPFPGLLKMSLQVLWCFFLEDTFHYWAHRALHYGPFYKHVHKMHHLYSAPSGLAAEYAHPIEIMVLGMGTFLGPISLCLFFKDLHIITVLAWVSLRIVQAVDAHSGYDFPWSLQNILPFWGGAEHHDYHHQFFVNCYSSSFRWWDSAFKTDLKYHAHKERLTNKNSNSSSSANNSSTVLLSKLTKS